MAGNRFGQWLSMTTFGESHGPAMGVVVDGCPAGVLWDEELVQLNLARRKPGAHGKHREVSSARSEADSIEVLSGVFDGKTLGTPIAVIVRNRDARSADYDQLRNQSRTGHADDLWQDKFGHRDHRGGGRASGRETVARVIAGSIAQMFVKTIYPEIHAVSYAATIGPLELNKSERESARQQTVEDISKCVAGFPSVAKSASVKQLLLEAKEQGKSYGGMIEVWFENVPRGLGQPVFHKLKADLAAAVLSIGAVTSFELGVGDKAAQQEGSEFHSSSDLKSSRYGGLRGGISTGDPLLFRAALKPTSSIKDIAKKGRHDPCIVPRALAVVEAMIWFVLADHVLQSRGDRI